jgi:hypothetical protein
MSLRLCSPSPCFFQALVEKTNGQKNNKIINLSSPLPIGIDIDVFDGGKHIAQSHARSRDENRWDI